MNHSTPKLSYYDYLLTLRYSIYRLIEIYGPETEVDIYIDELRTKIISIIEEPRNQKTKKISTTLINLLIQTILITNPYIDIIPLLLRTYRYIHKQTLKDFSEAICIPLEEYIALERGNNIHLINKHRNDVIKHLNIPLERIFTL